MTPAVQFIACCLRFYGFFCIRFVVTHIILPVQPLPANQLPQRSNISVLLTCLIFYYRNIIDTRHHTHHHRYIIKKATIISLSSFFYPTARLSYTSESIRKGHPFVMFSQEKNKKLFPLSTSLIHAFKRKTLKDLRNAWNSNMVWVSRNKPLCPEQLQWGYIQQIFFL